MRIVAITGLLALLAGRSCGAQDLASPKFVVFGGAGIADAANVTHGGTQFGADVEDAPPWSRTRSGFPTGFLLEGGYINPWNRFSAGSAIFSANYMASFDTTSNGQPKFLPFITGGYTRLFGSGNGVNFGGGMDFLRSSSFALRVELRDYLRVSGPSEHNFAIRIALVKYIRD
ncbi:MAG TPA: hypothetical protein VIX19_18280 [Terriglobales bacterium]